MVTLVEGLSVDFRNDCDIVVVLDKYTGVSCWMKAEVTSLELYFGTHP